MEMMKNFGLLGNLSISQKRELITELRAEIMADKAIAKAVKIEAKQAKAAARADKKAARIAALQVKIDALLNPVGAKAIKANRKPSKVTVTKTA